MGGANYFARMHVMKIVADKDIPHVDHFFAQETQIIYLPGRQITNDSLKEADGLLVRSITKVDETLLKNTQVKWVGSLTSGIDHLDTTWLDANNIAWRACPGFNAPPVADYVVSCIARLINKGYFTERKRAAVIGCGHVGALIVERLKTLDFDVITTDPLRASEPNFEHVPLQDIHDVDLTCVHTPLTKLVEHATYHMINAEFMSKQKQNCVLLNAARGAVIDTTALLTHGKHLIFCTDVFEDEPNINIDVLQQAFIATPHIAGHTQESKYRGVKELYEWTVKNGWLPVNKVRQLLEPHIISIPKSCEMWQHIVQHVFNIEKLSADMHATLGQTNTIGATFDQIRKHYGNRHEFSNTKLMGIEHVSQDDKAILRQFGLSC